MQRQERRVPQEVLDRIRAEVDLVDLVAEHVSLRKSGATMMGLCPFHRERSPSFHVYRDGHYHCFGCKKHGDNVQFVRETERLGFLDAVMHLARRAGISIDCIGGTASVAERNPLLEILDETARLAIGWLNGPEGVVARSFLTDERRLSGEIIARGRIGYIPPGEVLRETLHAKGWCDEQLIDAGVAVRVEDESGGQPRVRSCFTRRIAFPLVDRGGRVRGFSARVLPDSTSTRKYINSRDSTVFSKSECLYLPVPPRHGERTLMVEGPPDVLACLMHGVPAGSACGTALSVHQATTVIKRTGGPIAMCYDADAGGDDGLTNSLRSCWAAGGDVLVVGLPPGSDPGDILKDGSRLDAAATNLSDPVTVLWNLTAKDHEDTDRGKLERIEAIADHVSVIPDRDAMVLAMDRIDRCAGVESGTAQRRHLTAVRRVTVDPEPTQIEDRGGDAWVVAKMAAMFPATRRRAVLFADHAGRPAYAAIIRLWTAADAPVFGPDLVRAVEMADGMPGDAEDIAKDIIGSDEFADLDEGSALALIEESIERATSGAIA